MNRDQLMNKVLFLRARTRRALMGAGPIVVITLARAACGHTATYTAQHGWQIWINAC
jgi:hypothetical protein